jgi:hypothetical protein
LVICLILYRPPRPLGLAKYEVSTVRGASGVDPRREALLAADRLPGELGVPILQGALRDPVDEVRLLARSLLETRERGLYGALTKATDALAQADEARRPRLHARLASLNWELVYTGLARGDVASYLLSEALGHAEAACAREEDAGLRLLMGRIHLRRGDAPTAQAALRQARELGLASHLVVPYLMEAAFLLGQRDESTSRVPLAARGAEERLGLGEQGPNELRGGPVT